MRLSVQLSECDVTPGPDDVVYLGRGGIALIFRPWRQFAAAGRASSREAPRSQWVCRCVRLTGSRKKTLFSCPRKTVSTVWHACRRRRTARLEQSAVRDPSQLIAGCLQTFTGNSLLYPMFLLTLLLAYYFSATRPDIVKCPLGNFFLFTTL